MKLFTINCITIFTISLFIPGTEAAAGDLFSVERFIITSGIEEREPIDQIETVSKETDRIYCFLEARNITEDTIVTIVWFHNDRQVGSFQLELKQGSRWRTNAYKNLTEGPGDWKAEAHDANGQIVATASFKVDEIFR
jgi:hypothetical protein